MSRYIFILVFIFIGTLATSQVERFFVPYPNEGDTTYYYEVGNPEKINFEMFEKPQGYYFRETLTPCHISNYASANDGIYIWKRGLQEYHFSSNGNRMSLQYAVVKDVFKNTWARMQIEGNPEVFNDISSMSTYVNLDNKGSYSYQVAYLDETLQEILKESGATALWVSFALNSKYERLGTAKVILPFEDINCLTIKNTAFYIPTGFQIMVDGVWQKLGGELQMEVLDQFVPVTVPKIHFIDNGQKREVAELIIDPNDKNKFVSGYYMYNTAFKNLRTCNEEGGIYLFPNPSYGEFSIKMFDFPEGEYTLKVYNIVGKEIRSESINMTGNMLEHIYLAGISKGSYIYAIEDEYGQRIEAKRLMIMGL